MSCLSNDDKLLGNLSLAYNWIGILVLYLAGDSKVWAFTLPTVAGFTQW